MILILGLLLQSLMLFIGGRIVSTQGTYVQVLSALAHAGLVDKPARERRPPGPRS